MQNRYVMEGWLFANFVAMIAYYKLHVKLRQAELLSKYSPKGIIERSKAIYKMKIRGRWIQSENTKKMQRLFAKFPVAVVFWEVLQAGGGSGARQLNF
jgi:hypothetical protein